jgi:hypothetical protein
LRIYTHQISFYETQKGSYFAPKVWRKWPKVERKAQMRLAQNKSFLVFHKIKFDGRNCASVERKLQIRILKNSFQWILQQKLHNTINIFINKSCLECNVYSKPKQGVEQGKLPCSTPCLSPSSAHDKIESSNWEDEMNFSCFETIW